MPPFIRRYFPLIITLALVTIAANDCNGGQESQVTSFVDAQQDWYHKYQAYHFYTYSLELAVVQQIYDARNEARSTYSYSFSDFGNILFSCPSKGFPIPYGVQLTNPERYEYHSGGSVAIPQPEPSGLYTNGLSTSATWLSCVRKVETAPVYSEPMVMSFPFAVQEVNGRLYDIEDSPSSIALDLTRPANIPTDGPLGLPPEVIVK